MLVQKRKKTPYGVFWRIQYFRICFQISRIIA